jgi:hypothetical protein
MDVLSGQNLRLFQKSRGQFAYLSELLVLERGAGPPDRVSYMQTGAHESRVAARKMHS